MDFQKYTGKLSTLFKLPLLSGFLGGIGFLFPELRLFSWVALVPLFFFFDSQVSFKKIFQGGFLAGFVFFGQVFVWYFDTFPLYWLSISNPFIGICFVVLIWLMGVSFSALFFGFFGMAYRFFRKSNWLFLFSIPFLWIVFEYLRAFGSSFLLLGKNSFIGPYWTFGHLGYLLSQSPVLGNLAGLGGVYFLSLIIALFNIAFYLLLGRNSVKRSFLILFLVLCCFWLSGYFYSPEAEKPNNSFEIALINTQFDGRQSEEAKLLIQQELVKKAALQSPQFVVLPEGSQFLSFSQETGQFLQESFSTSNVLFIDVFKQDESGQSINRIIFFDVRDGELGHQDKLLLMPFGEYQPYVIRIPAGLMAKSWSDKLDLSRSLPEGNDITVIDFAGVKVGGLFCGDVISPDLYRKLSVESQVIFNVGNHSAFQNSSVLTNQIMAISKLRAAENNRYLARAANDDFSYVIDNKGIIAVISEGKENQAVFGEIQAISERSPYNRFGDWILIVALIFLLLFQKKSFLTNIFKRRITEPVE